MNHDLHVERAWTPTIMLAISGFSVACGLTVTAVAYADGLSMTYRVSLAATLAHLLIGVYSLSAGARRYTKPLILSLVSAQCAFVTVTQELPGLQLSALIPSLVVWLLMYHEPRKLRVIGAVHFASAAALLTFAGEAAATSVPWISYVVLAFVMISFAVAAQLTIHSNLTYWHRMTRLEAELACNEARLRETSAQLTEQHARLETTAEALRATAARNAPQVEALRLAYEEQAQIAQAASSGLREPLRNINAFVQLIRRRLQRLGAAEGAGEYLDFVTDGAARMNGMVDDLLRYSESAEQTATESVDTSDVLRAIRDNLADLLHREGASLHFPADLPAVLGHRTQVLQLFQNLISNGVKFKRPGVAPRCEVACEMRDGVAGFSVSDNGIGIPANRLADVFGLFTRLHERGAYEGTGIGLATCRRIVLAAGGEIWAESVEGEGTTFHFTWPLEVGLPPKLATPIPETLAAVS